MPDAVAVFRTTRAPMELADPKPEPVPLRNKETKNVTEPVPLALFEAVRKTTRKPTATLPVVA